MLRRWLPTCILGGRDKGSFQRGFYWILEIIWDYAKLRLSFAFSKVLTLKSLSSWRKVTVPVLGMWQWAVSIKEFNFFFCLCSPHQMSFKKNFFFKCNFLKRFYLFIHERHREKEKQRHRQREKQAPCRESHVGLDPRTPGSRPEPKAEAQLLSHPGIPSLPSFKATLLASNMNMSPLKATAHSLPSSS